MASMDQELKCGICRRMFSKKSSLIRHAKRCTDEPRLSTRRRSCQQCVDTKVKCDFKHACSRCVARGIMCQYPKHLAARQMGSNTETIQTVSESLNPAQSSSDIPSASLDNQVFSELVSTDFWGHSTSIFPDQGHITVTEFSSSGIPALDSNSLATNSSLLVGPNLTPAGNAWSLMFGPSTSTVPLLTKHSMHYLLRVLRTWPGMIARDVQMPPIFHAMHSLLESLPVPLANCVTLCKMWHGQIEGSSNLVYNTISNEMQTIFKNYSSRDEENLVASIQAITIYLIMLLFPVKTATTLPSLDQQMFVDIQRLVYYCVNMGLVLPEERKHTQPKWEDWVQVNTKRRAVLTLYLIHWSYSVHHGLPSFACVDLSFMPAPAAKMLWQATTNEQWEHRYVRWLSSWGNRPYFQGDFTLVQEGIKLDSRTEMWFEEADEFGMMFAAILNATDREACFQEYLPNSI